MKKKRKLGIILTTIFLAYLLGLSLISGLQYVGSSYYTSCSDREGNTISCPEPVPQFILQEYNALEIRNFYNQNKIFLLGGWTIFCGSIFFTSIVIYKRKGQGRK